jgi:hypothetical protein
LGRSNLGHLGVQSHLILVLQTLTRSLMGESRKKGAKQCVDNP